MQLSSIRIGSIDRIGQTLVKGTQIIHDSGDRMGTATFPILHYLNSTPRVDSALVDQGVVDDFIRVGQAVEVSASEETGAQFGEVLFGEPMFGGELASEVIFRG